MSTPEKIEQYSAANTRGGIEGFIGSLAVMGGASFYFHKASPIYRALPTSIKSGAILVPVLAATVIQAERRGLEYEKSTWNDDMGSSLMRVEQAEEERHYETLSGKERILEWVDKNEYSVIMGAWAASLGLSGAIISRNKYQTFAQKIVQARMWAQGLTIGLLIGAGMFHAFRVKQGHIPTVKDHSWKDIIKAQEDQKLKIKAVA